MTAATNATNATNTTVETDPDFNAYLSLCEELSTEHGFDVFFSGIGVYTDDDITEYRIGVEDGEHSAKLAFTIIPTEDAQQYVVSRVQVNSGGTDSALHEANKRLAKELKKGPLSPVDAASFIARLLRRVMGMSPADSAK